MSQMSRKAIERNASLGSEWSDFVLGAPIDRRGNLGKVLARHLTMRTAVYAIGLQTGPPIKIGFSRKPAIRLVEVQISSPQELRFHLVCWLPSKKEAVALEQRCHKILRDAGRHLRGEWFDLTPIEAAKVIDRASIDIDCRIVPHRDLVKKFPLSQDPLAGCWWLKA